MLIFSFLSLNPFPVFVTNKTFHMLYDLKLFGNGASTFSDNVLCRGWTEILGRSGRPWHACF